MKISQLIITCSKSAIEIIEKIVKYPQSQQWKHRNDVIEVIIDAVLVFLLLTLNIFHTFFRCFHSWLWTVNVSWDLLCREHKQIYESWSYLRLLNDHKVGEVMTSSEVVSCNLVMGWRDKVLRYALQWFHSKQKSCLSMIKDMLGIVFKFNVYY